MAYEFIIHTNLSEKNCEEIENLMQLSSLFYKKEKVFGALYYLLKDKNEYINISIRISKDELFISQFTSSNVWHQINFIKEYLENHKIEYEIKEL